MAPRQGQDIRRTDPRRRDADQDFPMAYLRLRHLFETTRPRLYEANRLHVDTMLLRVRRRRTRLHRARASEITTAAACNSLLQVEDPFDPGLLHGREGFEVIREGHPVSYQRG